MDDAFTYCEQRVREGDRDRFLSALFARAERRPLLYALYAFDLEIAGLGARLREPMAGELRLQWWREALEGHRADEAQGNPVTGALLATMAQASLPAEMMLGLLEARSLDLYAEPMVSTPQFDAHARSTTGAVLDLAARILGSAGGLALEAAVIPAALALGYADATRRFAADAARGRVSIPLDVLERHGADPSDVLARRTTPALVAALAEMRMQGHKHFDVAQRAIVLLPVAVRPAFLHVSLVPLALHQAERRRDDLFGAPIEVAPWRRQWALWWTARKWLR